VPAPRHAPQLLKVLADHAPVSKYVVVLPTSASVIKQFWFVL